MYYINRATAPIQCAIFLASSSLLASNYHVSLHGQVPFAIYPAYQSVDSASIAAMTELIAANFYFGEYYPFLLNNLITYYFSDNLENLTAYTLNIYQKLIESFINTPARYVVHKCGRSEHEIERLRALLSSALLTKGLQQILKLKELNKEPQKAKEPREIEINVKSHTNSLKIIRSRQSTAGRIKNPIVIPNFQETRGKTENSDQNNKHPQESYDLLTGESVLQFETDLSEANDWQSNSSLSLDPFELNW